MLPWGSEQMAPSPDRAPVEAGDAYHIEIQELGTEGDGIGYVDDFVVIVPEASLGESVTVEVTRVEESFAMARALESRGT